MGLPLMLPARRPQADRDACAGPLVLVDQTAEHSPPLNRQATGSAGFLLLVGWPCWLDPSGNGCPCFGDQPRIGIDQTNLYVTADEFSVLGPQFNGAEMWVIDKSDLVNGVMTPHVVSFPHLTIDTLAPQPALSTGRPDAGYFLSSLDPSGTGDNRIGLWAVTNRDQVGLGGMSALSSVVINSEAYAVPPPAPQKCAKSKLDSGDDRMQLTQFVAGTVWGELTTAVQPLG